MEKRKIEISDTTKMQYAGITVLEYMINRPKSYPVLLEGNDQDLETILAWLMTKEYVEIADNHTYMPTEKGRTVLEAFLKRYLEFLRVFDVFCAVDLEAGEFAFAKLLDPDSTNEQWQAHLDDERWDDLRVAVAEYKKLDPVEIIFMSFLTEGHFGRDQSGWQFDLLVGSIWDEIKNVTATSIHWEDLNYEDEEGSVSAKVVIESIISEGAELMIALHKEEDDHDHTRSIAGSASESEGEDEDESLTMDRVAVDDFSTGYYLPYRDPFYVSPLLLGLWLL